MTEIVVFSFRSLIGALTVITWALCAAGKRGENDNDTSDR